MITDKIKQLLESRVVALGTISDFPNVTPVSSCKVVDGQVIITANFMDETVKNIQRDEKVCLAVWDATPGEEFGYKLFGKAKYFDTGKWLDFVINLKENSEYPAKGAIVFTPDSIKDI